MLLKCCDKEPILIYADEKDYPGSVKYECSICYKTTLSCYSTLGSKSSIELAEIEWNKIKCGSISLSHDNDI